MHNIAFEAKQFCRQQHSGVLSTQSTSVPGYPFGSVVPFFITAEGDVIIYISDIALHTRNIKANEKVSLTIFDGTQDDSQANARVTILGDAKRIEPEQFSEQYFRLFPQAIAYLQTHDFHFYKISTVRVRYIGGFGRIHWINPEHWSRESQEWYLHTNDILNHMNKDHQEAMQAIIAMRHGYHASAVTMLSAFPEGVHYRAENQQVYYVGFSCVADDPMAIRKALVAQSKEAREQTAPQC